MSYLKEYKQLFWESDGLYNSFMEHFGLSASESMTLFCVANGIDNQMAICKKLYMPKQTVHSAIKKLENAGIVVVSAQKSKDKTKKIALTDIGYKVYKKKVFPLDEVENEAFEQLDENEQREMVRITAKYNGLLRKAMSDYIANEQRND